MSKVRWVVPFSLCLALPAWGQTASEIAAAKQWFSEGMALEEKGQFADALVRFKKAMAVKKTPQIVFHVGLCELRTGALVEALVSFERAVELSKTEGNAQVESAASAELTSLRPRVPTLEIVIVGQAAPKRVLLDGTEIAGATLGTAMPVNPGAHEVIAEFDDGTVKQRVSVAERGKGKVELTPPAPGKQPAATPVTGGAPPGPKPAPTPEPTPAAPPAPSPSVVPWVLIGGGVVFAAAGFYTWKLRGDQIDALDAMCPAKDDCPVERAGDVDDAESKGRTYTTLSFAAWGIGAAALGAGTVMLLGSSSKERASAQVGPVIGPGFSGASLRGRF